MPDIAFTIRPASWEDLESIATLMLAVCVADGDLSVAATPDDIKQQWTAPGFNMGTDTWVAVSPGGQLLGYEDFVIRSVHASLMGDGYVHPEYNGCGIGTALMQALEARARQELALADPALRVFICNGMMTSDKSGCELHESMGYSVIRYSWQMKITLESPPPAPVFPAGLRIENYRTEQDERLMYEVDMDAFKDHWGHAHTTFEAWKHRALGRESFDPALWFLAWDGDEVAGFAQCRYRSGIGWIGSLGVRRAWRKRGLGLALLQHCFDVFYQRGMPTIGLGVDASSLTGATRLYQRAGMSVSSEYVLYEKELRSGREPGENE